MEKSFVLRYIASEQITGSECIIICIHLFTQRVLDNKARTQYMHQATNERDTNRCLNTQEMLMFAYRGASDSTPEFIKWSSNSIKDLDPSLLFYSETLSLFPSVRISQGQKIDASLLCVMITTQGGHKGVGKGDFKGCLQARLLHFLHQEDFWKVFHPYSCLHFNSNIA